MKETSFVYRDKRGFLLFYKVHYGIITATNRNFTRYSNMLERMGEFFDARLNGYEEHQLKTIASAEEFYLQQTAFRRCLVRGSWIWDVARAWN